MPIELNELPELRDAIVNLVAEVRAAASVVAAALDVVD